jgi:hypothetical protein
MNGGVAHASKRNESGRRHETLGLQERPPEQTRKAPYNIGLRRRLFFCSHDAIGSRIFKPGEPQRANACGLLLRWSRQPLRDGGKISRTFCSIVRNSSTRTPHRPRRVRGKFSFPWSVPIRCRAVAHFASASTLTGGFFFVHHCGKNVLPGVIGVLP